MERLLLVNFERDPDETYVGLEPQVFADAIHGTGHLVIGWRQDGRVDVYHEPGLKLTADRYDITGKGLAHMVERQFTAATYEVGDSGVEAHYEFRDIHDRAVVIRVSERNPRTRKPFGLLAPMGAVAEAPSAMPLVLLHDFYFVRKRHTTIEISFDGNRHRPDELPVPMDFTRMLFTRYSPRPLIATLNPAFDGLLEPLEIRPGQADIPLDEHAIGVEWTNGVPAVGRVTRRHARYPVDLSFDPAFPDIGTLADSTTIDGRFEIAGHPSTGRIVGAYRAEKTDGQTTIVMIPTPGWKPRPTKLALRFLYTVARIFTHWPATYRWTAIVQEREHGSVAMRSGWCRIP